MPAMTNILVKDDKLVEKTLIPVTDTPFPMWRTDDPSLPIDGQTRLSVEVVQLKNKTWKVSRKLEVPVMEQVTGGTSGGYVAPPKVAHVMTDVHTLYFSSRATSTDRAAILRMALGLDQGASSTTASGIITQTSVADSYLAAAVPIMAMFKSGLVPF